MEFAFPITEAHKSWSLKRESTVTLIRQVADELDDLHKKVNISNVTGASVSAVGSGIAIGGWLLAPFTLGTSAAIGTAVGTALCVAGGLTVAGATISEIVISGKTIPKATKAVEEDRKTSENLNHTLQTSQDLECNLKNLLLRIDVANKYLTEMMTTESILGKDSDEIIKHTDQEKLMDEWLIKQISAAEDFQEILGLFDQCLAEIFRRSPGFSASLLMNKFPDITKRNNLLSVGMENITAESEALMFELLARSAVMEFIECEEVDGAFGNCLQRIGKDIVIACSVAMKTDGCNLAVKSQSTIIGLQTFGAVLIAKRDGVESLKISSFIFNQGGANASDSALNTFQSIKDILDIEKLEVTETHAFVKVAEKADALLGKEAVEGLVAVENAGEMVVQASEAAFNVGEEIGEGVLGAAKTANAGLNVAEGAGEAVAGAGKAAGAGLNVGEGIGEGIMGVGKIAEGAAKGGGEAVAGAGKAAGAGLNVGEGIGEGIFRVGEIAEGVAKAGLNVAEGAGEAVAGAGKAAGAGLKVGEGIGEGILGVGKVAGEAALAGGQGAKALLKDIPVLNIALLPLDIVQIVISAKNLKEGCIHPASIKLQEKADALQSDTDNILPAVKQLEEDLQTMAMLTQIGCTSLNAYKQKMMRARLSPMKAIAKKASAKLLSQYHVKKSKETEKERWKTKEEDKEEDDEMEEKKETRLSVMTINVRGLRNMPQLLGLIVYYLAELKTDILFLQETHFLPDDRFSQSLSILGSLYHSPGTSRSRGVATLLTRSFLIRNPTGGTTIDHNYSYGGRCKIVDTSVSGKHFRLVNIYAPDGERRQTERSRFFSDIVGYIAEHADSRRLLIFGGDFNVRVNSGEVSLITSTDLEKHQIVNFLRILPEKIKTLADFATERVLKVNGWLGTSNVTDVQVTINPNNTSELRPLMERFSLNDIYNEQQGYTFAYRIPSATSSRGMTGTEYRYGTSRLDLFLVHKTSDIRVHSSIEHGTRHGEAPLTDHSGVQLELCWVKREKKRKK